MIPLVGVSLHFDRINTIQSMATIPTRTTIEISNESLTTSIARPPLISDQMNQGKGRPMVTSKILDPIEEDTAELADPFFTLTMDVNMSGTLVPAAKIVKPMTVSGMYYASPKTVDHHTIRFENITIHTIDIIKLSI